jgi:fructoselysine-6-P-deglycase FrlB-like protein
MTTPSKRSLPVKWKLYGEKDAVLLGISTSGASKNVIAAFEQARKMEMKTIALTGEDGGQLGALADYLLAVPCRHTPLIQQVHTCLYHYLCGRVEERLVAIEMAVASRKSSAWSRRHSDKSPREESPS